MSHQDLIRTAISQKFGPIYQLIERSGPPEEKFIDQVWDYLSMGRRRIAWMILRACWEIFLVATAGGFLGEFLTLYEESRNDSSAEATPQRNRFYWVMSTLIALAGGGVALGYGYKEMHIFGALYLGASAPVFLKSGIGSFAPPAKPKIGVAPAESLRP